MATTQKALDIAYKLRDELRGRVQTSAYFVNDIQFDSDGSPYFTLGDAVPASHEKNWIIKVRPVDWSLAKDVLGNTAIPYGPHVIQLAIEAGAASNFADFGYADLLQVLSSCAQQGCKLELYARTAGTLVAIGDITGANLKSSWEPNPQYAMIQNQ